jgi:hypothetical protein
MSTQETIWVFFNVKTQQQTKPLKQTEAHLFILQMKKTDVRHYVIWTPGWKKWIPVSEMLRSEQKHFQIPPPIDQLDEDATQLTEEITGSSLNTERTYTRINLTSNPPGGSQEFEADSVNWDKTPIKPVLAKNGESKKGEDRREYKRFPHRIELVLMTKKGKSFRSSSLNVSLGGALLREPVPQELLRDVMDLLIINPFPDKETPSHLLIKGRVVGDTQNLRRLMFYDVSPDVQKKLHSILERYQKNYREFKKKKAG